MSTFKPPQESHRGSSVCERAVLLARKSDGAALTVATWSLIKEPQITRVKIWIDQSQTDVGRPHIDRLPVKIRQNKRATAASSRKPDERIEAAR